MSNPEVNIGVVGATGLVGGKMLDVLERRDFPVGNLRLFASESSAGRTIEWHGDKHVIEHAGEADFSGLDIVLFSAGKKASENLAPKVVSSGATVIDNSPAWRMDDDVPLVVAEVNPEALDSIPKGIVANPNCTTMIGMVALKPLHAAAGLKSLIVDTYQSTSGQGRRGTQELYDQTVELLEKTHELTDGTAGKLPAAQVFPKVAAFNVAPQAGTFEGDDTSEELKFINESRKTLGLGDLAVQATCIRSPVFNGHSMAIHAGFERKISPDFAKRVLRKAPGVSLQTVPQPIFAAGRDDILVGRIRTNPAMENGLSIFVSGDNLLKGAALNAVQIAELLIER